MFAITKDRGTYVWGGKKYFFVPIKIKSTSQSIAPADRCCSYLHGITIMEMLKYKLCEWCFHSKQRMQNILNEDAQGKMGPYENFTGHERVVHNTSWPATKLRASCFACQMWLMRTSLHSHTLCVPVEKSLLGYTQTHRNPNSLVISQKGTCCSIVDACSLVFTSYLQQRHGTLWVTQSCKQSHACALHTLLSLWRIFVPNLFRTCAFSSALILITYLSPTSCSIPVYPSTPSLLIPPKHLSC